MKYEDDGAQGAKRDARELRRRKRFVESPARRKRMRQLTKARMKRRPAR